MKKKILIIIPVLNEEKNIKPLIKKIFSHLKKKDKDLLFIDDNSKDNTRKEILKFQKKYKNKIYLIKRKKKLGIGSAHKCGLIWGYKKKYKIIITMDGDGTHDPYYITKMLSFLETNICQLISTNRFLNRGSLKSWKIWRKFLTTLRHFVIQLMLNIKFDSSGAFRGYFVNEIKLKDILKANNNSYSFFWESIFILSKKYKVKEIPIKLPARLSGNSKMKIKDIFLALIYLIYFSFFKRFFI